MENDVDEHIDLGSFDLIGDLAHQHPAYSNFVSHIAELLASGSAERASFLPLSTTLSRARQVLLGSLLTSRGVEIFGGEDSTKKLK
ncbi:hypothetical protein CONPUDRAFT_160949 [Coniophora puteana RWD-64-598 SS2]|uniref:Uncharacterized protein n=1 Tax=Coniophora puteana (strain RWD-64-598) TaxID=741705 RepID=A0A5M3N475_CONPW|nr:uncharacterized protein CONPUDRAFT_160949 [Coniophora puteana RWD-64-598 SS2]EIW86096.1 hypothetical protein CONPUDRAFT_160949 [Coniophora puteana RWD-64-598 SS2]